MVGGVNPLGRALLPHDGEVHPADAVGGYSEQFRCRVHAGDHAARAGGEYGGVAGAGADIQDCVAWPDVRRFDGYDGGVDEPLCHGGIVAERPGGRLVLPARIGHWSVLRCVGGLAGVPRAIREVPAACWRRCRARASAAAAGVTPVCVAS
jgi:hypothetical protein